MNNCPKCQQSNTRKAGKVKDKQRYKCRDCNYYYSVLSKSGSGNKIQKRQALELYLEGLGFRSIGRLLNFSHVTIHNWIKEYGKNLDLLRNNHEVCLTEIDEMRSYIGSKKNAVWIWIAVDRYTKEFISFTIGNRATKTGIKLWDQIKERSKGFVATDYWGSYEKFVPRNKHVQSKAYIYTVEVYNSLFRHFLARMRRKSKCYSKSKEMLEYSVKLLILKRNGILDILN